MKKEIYVPIFGIIAAEGLMFFDKIFQGLGIHIVNLFTIIFIIVFSSVRLEEKNILQSLILIIMLRIVNLSMPQFFTVAILQHSLIYGIMFIPIYHVINNQQISLKELGIDFRKLYIYLPVAIFIGIIIGLIEYKILSSISFIEEIKISSMILISIIMFVFIGPVEEIIFRSIIQTRIEKVFGSMSAILLSGGLFGVMHASYGMINEIMFTTMFGIVLSYIFYRTRNLPFIVTIHGTANVMSFGILAKMLI